MTVATIDTPAALTRTDASAPITELLRAAVMQGTPVEQLERLVDLHEKMDARQAQRDFAAAMAAFQMECPSIKRSSTANFSTRGGGAMSYTFAALDEIATTINPILAKHGLSYTWDATVDGGSLTCVCTVRHCNGFSTSSSIKLPTESPSAMSSQQKVGSALTFAKRLSLTSALGLTTTDEDTDGRDTDGDSGAINDKQIERLEALIVEVNANLPKFLKYLGVESLGEIPAAKYTAAVKDLEKKRAKA